MTRSDIRNVGPGRALAGTLLGQSELEGKRRVSMERITSDEVRHLSVLARVGMTDDEVDRMRDEMSHILDNIDVLNQVDTEGVEPTGHSVDVDSVMREDEARPSSSVDDVMANAPNREEDHIRVRAVLE